MATDEMGPVDEKLLASLATFAHRFNELVGEVLGDRCQILAVLGTETIGLATCGTVTDPYYQMEVLSFAFSEIAQKYPEAAMQFAQAHADEDFVSFGPDEKVINIKTADEISRLL